MYFPAQGDPYIARDSYMNQNIARALQLSGPGYGVQGMPMPTQYGQVGQQAGQIGQVGVPKAIGGNSTMKNIGNAIQQAAQNQQLQQLYQPHAQFGAGMQQISTQPMQLYQPQMFQYNEPQMMMAYPHSSPYSYGGFQNGGS